ncbi:histidine phosphatase family protein [Sphingomonas profundi]|uniref:histidine phosphatase family protein n=1 Tax=Alterirhizorhabdus profundi TaxID=2681549 RepID=UPI0012E809A6|nr:histidine phosphatase family protein [Sphingomonas profundi]
MTTLVIVRHGNTFAPGETPLRIGARTDLPLVPGGIAQARALGGWFAGAGIRFDRAFVSPLRRTQETAALILDDQPDPPAIEPAGWLAEIDHGPDEGRTDAAVVARIGADALAQWDERAVPPPGWLVDKESRLAAWRALYDAAEGMGGTLLIVTSNGSARFALMAQVALHAEARALPSLKIRTGAWGEIAVEAGVARLCGWDLRPPAQ